MKRITSNRVMSVACVVVTMLFMFVAISGATTNFDKITGPIIELINSILNPLLMVVGALGSIYCVFLGVKYAKSEEPQEREKAKSHLKNAIIGFVLIFVLMLAIRLLLPILSDWVVENTKETTTIKT